MVVLHTSWFLHITIEVTVYILGRPNNMSYNKGSTVVDVVSHHSLQVHLGPTEEEQLYNSSTSTDTGPHEGSPAILRNRMSQNSNYHM